jgi:hypothetical protein
VQAAGCLGRQWEQGARVGRIWRRGKPPSQERVIGAQEGPPWRSSPLSASAPLPPPPGRRKNSHPYSRRARNRSLVNRRQTPVPSRRRQNYRPSSRRARNRSLGHRHRIPGMIRRRGSQGRGQGCLGRRKRRRSSDGFMRGCICRDRTTHRCRMPAPPTHIRRLPSGSTTTTRWSPSDFASRVASVLVVGCHTGTFWIDQTCVHSMTT